MFLKMGVTGVFSDSDIFTHRQDSQRSHGTSAIISGVVAETCHRHTIILLLARGQNKPIQCYWTIQLLFSLRLRRRSPRFQERFQTLHSLNAPSEEFREDAYACVCVDRMSPFATMCKECPGSPYLQDRIAAAHKARASVSISR